MSLKQKLNRMKKHLGSESNENVTEKPEGVKLQSERSSDKVDIPFLEEWTAFDAKPYFFDGEYIFIREKIFSLSTNHGLYPLGDLQKVVMGWNQSSFEHPLSVAGFESKDLFFFDTETTGLGGGTGNTIFLLGYARVFNDKVILRQLFLPSPASEVALYHYFLQEVDYTTLVTYNGKAFDWPQVKTRHTMIRDEVPKLPKFGHFDLLHASRRLWKKEYDSLKLSLVEKQILNITRDGDIPGYMAPMIYFHYLEDQNPEGVFGIMKHNETDILTLITLFTHISNKLLKAEQGSQTEQFEVARWYASVGEKDAATKQYEQILHKKGTYSWAAKKALAEFYKKEKKLKEAIKLWLELQDDEQLPLDERIHAAIELAKYYEHKEKVIGKALTFTKQALSWANQLAYYKEDLIRKRLNRLEIKNIKYTDIS
ncbi:ribonuclease H-like domain-containing protein [Bacillus pinisoli]|uniref:ribonuclease H-like domain-containing protein n=1 Tax=Bacillus pinisoli TaxID=2901866 RepID=UPI001FF17F9C|nr:ribonuclease H-like domain-containing protein [Bacillus pinisoli]